MSECHGSSPECGTGDITLPNGPVMCGFCHPEALSVWDAQVIRDFERFLTEIAPLIRPGGAKYLDWRWKAYIRGEMGAPPLMWEGDNG